MESAVFLDTSIQIARFIHSPAIKVKIEKTLSKYGISITSLVVRQEFKRRFLREALYLLKQLRHYKSLEKVNRHVIDYLPHQQGRKKQICLEIIQTVFEMADDAENTERATLFLTSLLKTGLKEFDTTVGHVFARSNCACGKTDIRVKRTGNFDFGTSKCSARNDCGIHGFLDESTAARQAIRDHLNSLSSSEKSTEILAAEKFLNALDAGEDPTDCDPCLTVGDLLIALESAGVPLFYTKNIKESQHLCVPLDQTMIVSKSNPEVEDIVFPPDQVS